MPDVVHQLNAKNPNQKLKDLSKPQKSNFETHKLSNFNNNLEAYHHLKINLVALLLHSTNFILKLHLGESIFVGGGFSKKSIYMNLLTTYYPDMEIYVASIVQAFAVGTAIAIYKHLNTKT